MSRARALRGLWTAPIALLALLGCKPGGGANLSAGTFYEGAIVAGYPSDATDNAVQADITAAGYR
ncbi:arabinofuranosidase catalytic domain-containing protein [Streptomyces sp. NPDC005474]|uniref:arabinofuranosidase catalytic domain-containing protein n=1 Tax=Streptomyces sp. NPDC005474 TaxID=3154878 RepID=UPI0034541160